MTRYSVIYLMLQTHHWLSPESESVLEIQTLSDKMSSLCVEYKNKDILTWRFVRFQAV